MSAPSSYALKIAFVARLLRTRFDRRARALGLTRAQWQTIATIRLREGLTQSEVATALDVSSVTIGRLIDRLEQDGWVERRPDAADRRAYRLHLQPGAESILHQLGEISGEEERQMLAGLSEAECVAFRDTLDRMIANLGGRESGDPAMRVTD